MKARDLPIAVLVAVLPLGAVAQAPRHPVYPPKGPALHFSHRNHEQAACESCHPGGGQGDRPVPLALRGHQDCRGCHPQADAGGGKSTACGLCHAGERGPGKSIRLAAALKFSHRLHVSVPEGCQTCHRPEDDNRTGILPAASRCEPCHAELMKRRRCDACHPAGSDGRLLTDLEGGTLLPMGGHGGDAHTIGWERHHGGVARRREAGCRVCHTVRSCDRCHRGVVRQVELHPADWELSHAGPARAGRAECHRCHRDQGMCLACHLRSGVAETSTERPRNRRLHPEGFDSDHRNEARRNLRACASCHGERDCIRCHGAPGIGLGRNPHPPGFSRRCRLLRSRNPRPCAKCHPAGDLEARCP